MISRSKFILEVDDFFHGNSTEFVDDFFHRITRAHTHLYIFHFPLILDSSYLFPEPMASNSSSQTPKLKLYSYWRSSCSQRVRIALNLKGLEYEYKAVNLLKGEQFSPEFERLNPLHFVPVLVDGDIVISDSFAIMLYLEEKYPQNPLLPDDLQKKALNYQVASIVGSTIQPLQNLGLLRFIEEKLGENEKLQWARNQIGNGFAAIETLLKDQAGKYATGDEVSLADIFLGPQIYNGIKRFNIDMTPFPLLARLYEAYWKLPAFQAAHPDVQPDAPSI